MFEKQPWQKKLENGYIGEIRTKTLLADVFWIMTNSIDVNGADLHIRLADLTWNFDGNHVPVIGTVQAKFVQSNDTLIKINEKYVENIDKTAKSLFYLFIHTGVKDEKKFYFLTSKDIIKDFKFNKKSKHNKKKRKIKTVYEFSLKDIEKINNKELKYEQYDFNNYKKVLDYIFNEFENAQYTDYVWRGISQIQLMIAAMIEEKKGTLIKENQVQLLSLKIYEELLHIQENLATLIIKEDIRSLEMAIDTFRKDGQDEISNWNMYGNNNKISELKNLIFNNGE